MLIMRTGAIRNIVLDPALIILFGRENGILGAAVATVTAQLFQAILALMYFVRKSDTVKINRIRIVAPVAKPVLDVGVSAILMQVMTLLRQIVLCIGAVLMARSLKQMQNEQTVQVSGKNAENAV